MPGMGFGFGFGFHRRASGSGAFTPTDLDNLAAWWQYNTGITDASGAVSQWDDQSGNDRHLKQATATNQPTKQSGGAILFDGVDNFLKTDAFTLDQPFTVYLLMKQVTWDDNDYIFDGGSGNEVVLRQKVSSPGIQLIDVPGADITGTASGLTLGDYGIVTAIPATADTILQVNNDTEETGDFLGTSLSGFTLGGIGSGSASTVANIEVKEVIIYSVAHSEAQRTQVKNYLAGVGELSL